MKNRLLTLMNVAAASVLIASLFMSSVVPSSSLAEYDHWCDLNDDGEIDIFDLVIMAGKYGTSGTPINKTQLLLDLLLKIEQLNTTIIEQQNTINLLNSTANYLNTTVVQLNETVTILNSTGLGAPDYDSGWRTFPTLTSVQITHNLGTMDIIVYMWGKDAWGGFHQRAFGGDICNNYEDKQYGAWWSASSSNSIYVYNTARGQVDIFWRQVRVLIWKIPEP